MTTIIGLDLGKFNSAACTFLTGDGEVRFQSLPTKIAAIQQFFEQERPDLVVFEACAQAGFTADLCRRLGLKYLVANTNGEAWKWKNVKRKTDRDDALKLARLAYLGELPTDELPETATRQRRSFLNFPQLLVSQRVQLQNHLRSVLVPPERGVRESRIMLLNVKCYQILDAAECVERVQEQPLMLEHSPPGFNHRIQERDLGSSQDSALQSRGNQFIDGSIEVLDAAIDEQRGFTSGNALRCRKQNFHCDIRIKRPADLARQDPAGEVVDHGLHASSLTPSSTLTAATKAASAKALTRWIESFNSAVMPLSFE